jgi:hypothetical protein
MDADALQKMTVAELREEAKKLGDVKGIASMKKDDLVQLLADTSTATRASRKGSVVGLSLPVLKEKVRELKAKRSEATQKGQKSKVTEFNADLRTVRRRLRRAARRRRKTS